MPSITVIDARPLSATPISSPEVDFGGRGSRDDHGVDAITTGLSEERGGARIRIAEHTRPFRHARSEEVGGIHGNDGIYSMRAITRTATGQRSLSRSRTRTSEKDVEDDDPGLRRAGDYKQKQVFHGKTLLWLSYQSIGVIYGDIGTSPLYVFSSTFSSAPSHQDLVGVLSIIIWSLVMMVTVKYILVILRADNDGEGGTFSTYSLLSRYINITNRDPREASLIQMKRYKSGDLESAGRHLRHGIENSKIVRTVLKVIGVLAVSMVMSDGVLTPAQSVLGAVQGIEVVDPGISRGTVVGVTDAILVLLFVIQPLGITKITILFAPIIIIWLAFNAGFGIYNLVKFDWTVLKAFNPGYAFEYLIRNGEHGWRSLGGTLLAFTGVEALFADLGAFSRHAIQLSWLCYTLPCLLLAYIGQAAFISRHPDAYSNPFFKSVPPGTIYPSLIIAILAAIVASQAIITATFQLLAQIMKLSYFPQVKVVHTSTIFHGQLYVPLVNWLMMVATILVASVYKNTTSLGNAYGVCVMFVTFFDTCMVTLAAMFVWRFNPFYVFLPWLTIACLDGAYLSSALTKVPDGAWFTITLASVLAASFILWRFGKEQQWAAEAGDRFPTSHFVKNQERNGEQQLQLSRRYGGHSMSRIRGFGIFFDKAGETTPIVFSQFAIKMLAAPEVMVFFHLRPLETPSIDPAMRYTVSRLAIPNCYRLVVRYGYLDEIITPDLAEIIYDQVRDFIIRRGADRGPLNTLPTPKPHPDHQPEEEPPSTPKIRHASTAPPLTNDTTLPKNTTTDPTVPTTDIPDQPPNTTTPTTFPPPQSQTKPATTSETSSKKAAAELAGGTIIQTEELVHLELAKVEEAYAHQVLYIIGKEQMRVREGTGLWRRTLLYIFLWVRDNTRTKIANLRVPTERVVEVGFVKDV